MSTTWPEPIVPELPSPGAIGGGVVLKGISWEVYEKLLLQIGEAGQRIYLTYDRGTLEIMPPTPFHERYKSLLGAFVEIIRLEMGIPVASFGSTTYRREDLERGLEPDECYYVQHEPQMGGKFEIDLSVDPPPDLVIEIDYSHHKVDRESIYAALGVPEIWLFDGKQLRAMKRGEDGQYHLIERSIAFPFLRPADLEPFIRQAVETREDPAIRAFRDWLIATHRK